MLVDLKLVKPQKWITRLLVSKLRGKLTKHIPFSSRVFHTLKVFPYPFDPADENTRNPKSSNVFTAILTTSYKNRTKKENHLQR